MNNHGRGKSRILAHLALFPLTNKAVQSVASLICFSIAVNPTMTLRILDPCCGSRMFWFDRNDQRCLFGDIRHESITVTDRTHREDGTRAVHIHPDVQFDFRNMPFPDDTFYHVIFDPPHLVRAGPRSWLAAKYGKLGADWQEDLRKGFAECFRVLKPNGTLVFKWNEAQVPVKEVLACTNVKQLYGDRAERLNRTHEVVFMK